MEAKKIRLDSHGEELSWLPFLYYVSPQLGDPGLLKDFDINAAPRRPRRARRLNAMPVQASKPSDSIQQKLSAASAVKR